MKYVNSQCSPEEVKELLGHFDCAENEIPLRALITEALENTNAADEGSHRNAAIDEMFASIKNQLRAKSDKGGSFCNDDKLSLSGRNGTMAN